MIAPREHAGLSLRISVTDQCSLRCLYCRPEDGTTPRPHEDTLSYEEIARLARCLQEHFGLEKVRLTGGEPLVRPDIEKLLGMLSSMQIPDIALTTNGQRLEAMARALKNAGLHRANVSLDSLDPATFSDITRGGALDRTLAGIDAALREGLVPVKLNMLVMRDMNAAEICDVLSYGLDRGCEVRFLELMPIGVAAGLFSRQFFPAAAVRERLATGFQLTPLPTVTGASAQHYRATDKHGRCGVVGFIAPCSMPFCSGCRRLRLTANGRLMGCLAREGGEDIRALLRMGDMASLAVAVARVLRTKRTDRAFEQPATMASIGG